MHAGLSGRDGHRKNTPWSVVLGITGFGAAAAAAFGDVAHYREMAHWRDTFEAEIGAARPDMVLFGADVPRLGNTSCLAVGDKPSETMVMALDIAGVAVSAGSACSSGKVTASHVLKAMGLDDARASLAIRISLGWHSTSGDVEKCLAAWRDLYTRTRSPQATAAE